jgi:hypothetical protein
MKSKFPSKATNRAEVKNLRKSARKVSSINIAHRYMELRQLRKQISEAEALRNQS